MIMNFIKQIEREMKDNPLATLVVYSLIFSILWRYFDLRSLPFMFAVVIYEIKKSLSEKS